MWPKLKKNICPKNVPAGNYLVIVLAAIIFVLQFGCDPYEVYLRKLVLSNHLTSQSLLLHMWLHTDPLHFLETIILLFIFGRHVCFKIGNANFFLAFVFLGVASALVHWGLDGRDAIGASGAIMGILGMYVVFCFRRLSAAGPWIFLMWFMLSAVCGLAGLTDIANIDHCGGFVAGMILAAILFYAQIAEKSETDPNLLRAFDYLHAHLNVKRQKQIPTL